MAINLGSRIQRIVAVSPDLPLTEGQQMYLAGRIAYEMNELIGEVEQPLKAQLASERGTSEVLAEMYYRDPTEAAKMLNIMRQIDTLSAFARNEAK